MPSGAPEEFDADDQQLLEQLRLEDDEQQAAVAAPAAAPAPAPVSEQQSPPPAEPAPAPAPVAQPAPATPPAVDPPAADKPQGDVRAALRAARRSERHALNEADRLRAENEELRQRAAPPAPSPNAISDAEVQVLEDDSPVLAKAVRLVREATTAKPAAAPAAPAPTNREFVPQRLPDEVQEAVDDVPALSAWQNDPDQSRFDLAKRVDAMLKASPQWAKAGYVDRFNEVVKRVNAELGTASPSPPPPAVDPAAAIAAATRQLPNTLSDIGGGGGKQPEPANLERYQRMSDDDILADLARGG